MARMVDNTDLRNRANRLRLAVRKKPYWMALNEGMHLGYYWGQRVRKWVARFRRPGGSYHYHQAMIGEADDYADADGATILSFKQAQQVARNWFAEIGQNGKRRSSPYSVSDALNDYLEGFSGKDSKNTRRRIEAIIRPQTGQYDVSELTPKIIADWHWHLLRLLPASERRTARFKTIVQLLIQPMLGVAAVRALTTFLPF